MKKILYFFLFPLVFLASCSNTTGLMVDLKEGSPGERAEAARKLGELKDPVAVDFLISSLKDSESYVRREAAEALGEIGDERAVKPLIEALESEYTRTEAAEALAKIGAPSVDILIKTLAHDDAGVRGAAYEALEGIINTDSIGLLIKALKDDKSQVHALFLLTDLKPDSVNPLIEALSNQEPMIRAGAARTLANIGDSSAIPPLIACLNDGDPDVRGSCIFALGTMKVPEVVGPLIEALEDEEWSNRMGAAIALGEIKDTRVVKPLVEALKDGHPYVQRTAAAALKKIDDYQAAEALKAAGF